MSVWSGAMFETPGAWLHRTPRTPFRVGCRPRKSATMSFDWRSAAIESRYDRAAEIVKDASSSGRTLHDVAREHGVDEETLDKALDLRRIAAGSKASS